MKSFQYQILIIQKLDSIFRNQEKGTPTALASSLGISVRTFHDHRNLMCSILKPFKVKLVYSRVEKMYYYSPNGSLQNVWQWVAEKKA